ncbi:MAG: serine/threonine protein kinase [Gemmataceae bacterium]|nr:serine/threonine protein kinase [Gemmataceae bacterium]
MPVPPATTAEFLDLVGKSGALPPGRLAEAVPDPDGLPDDPKAAAKLLTQKGVLTQFQATQLLLGRYKGFRLGAYLIQDGLGRGGMGAVYLAEHTELHRKVAIKVLVLGKGDDQKLAAERFLREARAAAALDHPNIVRIFDVSRHNDLPYLVMEYVDGETLQQVLDRDGVVPFPTAADAVAQAAAGLQHAHEKGFVHRDIKPANLIRDRAGTVKVLDMGLARLATGDKDKLTERLDAGAVVGTADFISPEQALNAPDVDVRADIYSLGATFYALVSGRPPFEGNTAQKLLHHQISAAPRLTVADPSLPKGLAAVVARMLAKKPADRFQTPAEVIAALAPWLGNSPRVVAGLSKTKLGQRAALGDALDALRRGGSSRRLNPPVAVADGDGGPAWEEVDPSDAHDTAPTSGPRTARNPARKRKKKPAPKPSRAKLFALIGVGAVLLGGGVAVGVLAFGGKPEGNTAKSDGNNPGVSPKPPTPAPQPSAVPRPPRVVYRLPSAGQKAFKVRGGAEKVADRGRDFRFVQATKEGDGDFPPGWQATPYQHANEEAAEAEFWAEQADGKWALGLKNLRRQTAMLLSPDIHTPGGRCRVRFEYKTDAAGGRVGMFKYKKVDATNESGLYVLKDLDATGGAWRPVEVEADLKGSTDGYFEWHNTGPSAALLVRGFEVWAATPADAYAPVPLGPLATATTAEPLFDAEKTRDRFVFSAWGPRDVAGIPFVLADPRGGVNNVVLLRGSLGRQPTAAPEKVTIPVGRPVGAVHFLSGVAGWGWPWQAGDTDGDENKGKVVVTVRVKYADGRADEFPWVNGEHVADWIKKVDVPASEFAFPDEQNHQMRYLAVRPSDPTAVVTEIELVKGPDLPQVTPFVLAVTVEAPPPPVPKPQ